MNDKTSLAIRNWLPSISTSSLLFAIFGWFLLALRQGYTFGEGDHVEFLPYVLYLNNPDLFPYDFFIQGMTEIALNERILFVQFLSLFSGFLQPAILFLHFVCTVALLLGMEKLARMFIDNRYLAWLAILVNLIPLYVWTIGGNDLYYDTFQASNLASAIGIWGVVAFVKRKYVLSAILASVCTFAHIIIGLDLFIVLFLVSVYLYSAKGSPKLRTIIYSGAIFGFTAGIYLLALYLSRTVSTEVIPQAKYFDILFEFRHPHHYIFFAFPMSKRLFFIALMFIAVSFFGPRNKLVSLFILVSLLIMIGFIIAVDFLQIPFIANFQWYKMAIWLKFLGVIAIFGYLESLLPQLKRWLQFPKWLEMSGMISLSLAIAVLIFFFPTYSPVPVSYQFGDHIQRDAELSIERKIRQRTPVDAVFIQPFSNTSLKFYGRRSSYVDFKANVRTPAHVAKWYPRIQEVYGLSIAMKQQGFRLKTKADEFFRNHDPSTLEPLKQKGVTHILTWRDHRLPSYDVVAKNREFIVYKL